MAPYIYRTRGGSKMETIDGLLKSPNRLCTFKIDYEILNWKFFKRVVA